MRRSSTPARLTCATDVPVFLSGRVVATGATDPVDPDECMVWAGTCTGATPVSTINGVQGTPVRRAIWAALNGRPVPRRHVVVVHCDTPRCVHPGHLLLLSRANHGRRLAGTGIMVSPTRSRSLSLASAKRPDRLGPERAQQMLDARAAGASIAELVAQFQVTEKSVQYVLTGRSYKHLHATSTAWDGMLGALRSLQR